MSADTTAPASADTSVQKPEEPAPQLTADEKIPKHVYDRAMDDAKNQKRRAQELEEKLKHMELESMKKNQDWQKIAELKEQEARVAQEEREKLRGSLVFDKKFSAVKEAAMRAGLKKEAFNDLDMLNLDEVQIETTSTGRINVMGADDYVSRLKMTRPHWFGGASPSINANSPEVVSGGSITWEDLEKAKKAWKNGGDYANYDRVFRQYQQQSKRQ